MSSFFGNAIHMFEHEGLMALADPFGAYDRADARAELAGKFETVAPGGAESQNQVTSDHFDEIAKLYSDIRLGRTHIDVTPDELEPTASDDETTAAGKTGEVEAYRAGLMGHFAELMQTEPGRKLLEGLALQEDLPEDQRHAIEMSNFTDRDHELAFTELDTDGDGTVTRGERTDGSSPVMNKNARVRPMEGDTLLPFDKASAEWKQHHGLDATVMFTPGGGYKIPDAPWGPEMRPDVMLFHELTHAYHSIHGSMRTGEAHDMDGSETNECELQAVGLLDRKDLSDDERTLTENEYRAARVAMSGNTGALEGDADMQRRTTYTVAPDLKKMEKLAQKKEKKEKQKK